MTCVGTALTSQQHASAETQLVFPEQLGRPGSPLSRLAITDIKFLSSGHKQASQSVPHTNPYGLRSSLHYLLTSSIRVVVVKNILRLIRAAMHDELK